MAKLIPYSQFEKILDVIEEEIKNIDSLKEKMIKEDNFYLKDLEKIELKGLIKKLDFLLDVYNKKEIIEGGENEK